MLKKELARLLGVSESMVSRHAKQGMPTDSVERARRWRKRHLEPGRVKGQRYDPKAKAATTTKAAPAPDLGACISLLDHALQLGPVPHDAPVLTNTRTALRTMPNWRTAADSLAMPVRVWVRLIDALYRTSAVAKARAMEQAASMTAVQLADAMHEGNAPDWAAGVLLEVAWDLYEFDGRSLPDDDDEGDE